LLPTLLLASSAHLLLTVLLAFALRSVADEKPRAAKTETAAETDTDADAKKVSD